MSIVSNPFIGQIRHCKILSFLLQICSYDNMHLGLSNPFVAFIRSKYDAKNPFLSFLHISSCFQIRHVGIRHIFKSSQRHFHCSPFQIISLVTAAENPFSNSFRKLQNAIDFSQYPTRRKSLSNPVLSFGPKAQQKNTFFLSFSADEALQTSFQIIFITFILTAKSFPDIIGTAENRKIFPLKKSFPFTFNAIWHSQLPFIQNPLSFLLDTVAKSFSFSVKAHFQILSNPFMFSTIVEILSFSAENPFKSVHFPSNKMQTIASQLRYSAEKSLSKTFIIGRKYDSKSFSFLHIRALKDTVRSLPSAEIQCLFLRIKSYRRKIFHFLLYKGTAENARCRHFQLSLQKILFQNKALRKEILSFSADEASDHRTRCPFDFSASLSLPPEILSKSLSFLFIETSMMQNPSLFLLPFKLTPENPFGLSFIISLRKSFQSFQTFSGSTMQKSFPFLMRHRFSIFRKSFQISPDIQYKGTENFRPHWSKNFSNPFLFFPFKGFPDIVGVFPSSAQNSFQTRAVKIPFQIPWSKYASKIPFKQRQFKVPCIQTLSLTSFSFNFTSSLFLDFPVVVGFHHWFKNSRQNRFFSADEAGVPPCDKDAILTSLSSSSMSLLFIKVGVTVKKYFLFCFHGQLFP
ncbi:unnamed protein product [Acanthosepion pharaonis]|uniref:Uncharacterized protein n=1 Tax=Acanthosepion pharaonis TaxID=158019 RepID=A0A812D1U1_ACAPH|nr:unnamed protein product [Sepia pharaonis]